MILNDERWLWIIDFNIITFILTNNSNLNKKDIITIYTILLYLSQNWILKTTWKDILNQIEIWRDNFVNIINFLIENKIIQWEKLTYTKNKIYWELNYKIINFWKNIEVYNNKIEKKKKEIKIITQDELDKMNFKTWSILPGVLKKILKLNIKQSFHTYEVELFQKYLNDKVTKEKIDIKKLLKLIDDWLEYHLLKNDEIKSVSLSLNTWINNNIKKWF